MKLNLSQAAELVGITRSTLNRDIRAGRISVSRNGKDQRRIDIAELDRVYGPVQSQQVPPDTRAARAFQREIDLLRGWMKEKDAVIEDLRADRDYWRQQAGVLLMNQRRAAKPGRTASTPGAPKG